MQEKMINKQIVEATMKYFFYDLKTRSQTQHRDLVSDFRAFINNFSNADDYNSELKEIIDTPILFFIKHNPTYFKSTDKKKIDTCFTLANLDFLYFRDTNFSNKLKTDYTASYSRPSARNMKNLTLSNLLDITAFIRDMLYNNMIKIASENNLELPLIFPKVEQQEQGGIGIGTKTINL